MIETAAGLADQLLAGTQGMAPRQMNVQLLDDLPTGDANRGPATGPIAQQILLILPSSGRC
jgi:hypothetical protein